MRLMRVAPSIHAGLVAGLLLCGASGAFSQIESVTRLTTRPKRYARVDFVVVLTAPWQNPFRAEDIQLNGRLTTPSGRTLSVPGYFESGHSGAASVWKLKFTPEETGDYTCQFELKSRAAEYSATVTRFVVEPSELKGFLKAGDAWTFRFSDGTPFRGLGENLCWESRDVDDSKFFRQLHEHPRYNYDYLLGTLAAAGGNYFRTWMCPWNLPLEWEQPRNNSRYQPEAGQFNESAARRLDQLLERAAALDLYVMLAFNTASDFMGGDWERSDYNTKNGGPATNSLAFFLDPAAKRQYQNRLRYLVARWGWSPNVGAWEFFNEIDNWMYSQKPRVPDEVITAWHAEMSAYLRQVDPYAHLITTSVSHRDVTGLYDVATMDFNQRHYYGQTPKFPELIRQHQQSGGKPFVVGEFAYEWDWSKNFDDFADRMDSDFRNGLWAGLFSPTPILPMSWWWEYFDQRGMTLYFARVRRMLDQMLVAGSGSFSEVPSSWEGDRLRPLAVRCGKTTFVLLQNHGKTSASGKLRLNLPLAARATVYDAEADTTTARPDFAAGDVLVDGLLIAPDHNVILTFAPL